MRQILDDPAVASRIDVLFWEEHWAHATSASRNACSGSKELCIARGGFHYMGQGRLSPSGNFSVRLSDMYETFSKLRRLGILAHAWY